MAVQPEVLRGITVNKSFRGRGLLGRFLYVIPNSKIGYRTGTTTPLSDNDKTNYGRIMDALLNQTKIQISHYETQPHMLKLKPDAYEIWKAFWDENEISMREGNLLAHITDWAGKLCGAVIRLAGLLHCARYAFEQPLSYSLDKQDIEAAIRVAEALTSHALAAFDLMGADPALDGARHVLRWMKREGKPEFTFRDCHYAHKTRYKRKSDLEPVIAVLLERHFIRSKKMKASHGRQSCIYEVNPVILKN